MKPLTPAVAADRRNGGVKLIQALVWKWSCGNGFVKLM